MIAFSTSLEALMTDPVRSGFVVPLLAAAAAVSRDARHTRAGVKPSPGDTLHTSFCYYLPTHPATPSTSIPAETVSEEFPALRDRPLGRKNSASPTSGNPRLPRSGNSPTRINSSKHHPSPPGRDSGPRASSPDGKPPSLPRSPHGGRREVSATTSVLNENVAPARPPHRSYSRDPRRPRTKET